jgi:hypothetical protein
MIANDNTDKPTTPDENRLGESTESGVRVEPSVAGIGESRSGRLGYDGGKTENNASESAHRSDTASLRESIAQQLVDPLSELRVFRPSNDADIEETVKFVRQAITFSDEAVSSSENNIRSYLRAIEDNIDQSISFCDNCIRGCFGRICDKADELFSKCESKIRKRIDENIANSYYFTFQFFGPPPSTEQVLSELGLVTEKPTNDNTNITLEGSASGKPNCPPGFEPFWNGQEQRWICVPVCPPDHIRDIQTGACVPFVKPEPIEPPPKPPACPVEYPPTPGTGGTPSPTPQPPEPPCPPPPDLICPPGQIPAFVNGKWKCVPIDQQPGIGKPRDETNTVCFTEERKEPCLEWHNTSFLEFAFPNWNQANICDVLNAIKTRSEIYQGKLSEIIPWKFDTTDDKWVVPPEVHEVLQGVPSPIRAAILGVGGVLVGVVDLLMPVIPKIADCDMALLVPIQIIDGLLDLIEKYTGLKCNALTNSIQYLLNYICPNQLPSQGEINQLYYSQQISESTWQCLTRAIGNYDYWQKLIRDSNRPQLTPDELSVAYFRGLITKEQFENELVSRYGLPADVAKNYEKLKITLPGIGDLIRFMVRDVEDEAVYKTYKYDEGFNDKFKGNVELWSKFLGVPREVFLYYWRAHWELPSPTQLYEMLRRLRSDSVDPEARALAVTKKQVADALAANDIPEFWRDRLMAISYLPMTLSDAKIAYIEGAIDETTFKSLIKDSGRNDQHTQWIFELAERQKSRRIMNAIGGFSAKKVTDWFKLGAIDDAMARRLYADAGLTEELAEKALRIAKTAIRTERIESRIKIIKKRYLVGDLSPDQARALLIKIGAELNRVNELIEDWELEIQIRSKQVAAGVLCSWYYRKLITEDEYAIRLRRIGYQPADVERIITECAVSSAEKAFDRKVKTKRGLKALQEKPKPPSNGKQPK